MSPETLLHISAIVLSLAFIYIPYLQEKYDALTATGKRLVMLGLLFVVNAAVFALSCGGQFDYYTCDVDGVWAAVKLFAETIIINQTTYLVAPRRAEPEPVEPIDVA